MMQRKTWLIATMLLAVLVAGSFLIGRWSVPFDQRPGSVVPNVAPLLVSPRSGPIEEIIPLEAQIRFAEEHPVTMPVVEPSFRQIFTIAPLKPGDTVSAGTVLAAVNNLPILILPGALPSFRGLNVGDSGPDASQLNLALHDLGYLSETTGTITEETMTALAKLMTDQGFPTAPAALLERGIDGRMLAYSEQLPATVLSTHAFAGSSVDADSTSIRLGSGGLVLAVRPVQEVDSGLQDGTEIGFTCGALSGAGTLSSVQLEWSGMALDDSPSSTSLARRVATDADLATGVGSACAATARVQHSAELSVPVSALYSSTDGLEIHVHTAGTDFQAVPVNVGPAVGGWVPLVNPPSIVGVDVDLVVGVEQ